MPDAPAELDVLRGLLTALINDEASSGPAAGSWSEVLDAHRSLRRGPFGDLMQSLCCPTSQVPDLLDALGSSSQGQSGLDPVEVSLVADSGVLGVEKATHLLLDDDRVELVGLQVALPRAGEPEVFARHVLQALTFAVPSSIEVPQVPGWLQALDVLQDDGAERAAFRVLAAGDPFAVDQLAEAITAAVQRRVPFVVVGGLDGLSDSFGPHAGSPGTAEAQALLGLLGATAIAVDGGSQQEVATALTDPATWQTYRGEPRRVRHLLQAVGSQRPADLIVGLHQLGAVVDNF